MVREERIEKSRVTNNDLALPAFKVEQEALASFRVRFEMNLEPLMFEWINI